MLYDGWVGSELQWVALSLLFQREEYQTGQVKRVLYQFKLSIPELPELLNRYTVWQKTIKDRLN